MKKVINLFVIFIGIIFISGCTLGEKVATCTLENDQSKSGYKATTTYKVYYNKDVVTKVVSEEVLLTKNTTFIKYFEDLYKKQYEQQNKSYGGYTYDVKTEKDKVVSNVTIDYSKVNMEKFINDNSAMKSYVNENNKLTLDGAKKMYESLGAKCK